MITRERAHELVTEKIKNKNLVRHCLAVEAVMRGLAKRLNANEETWGIAGLLHDADYEETKDHPNSHTRKTIEWLNEIGSEKEVDDAILAHGYGYVEGNPEPKNPMEWSLFCCDELTGLIVAVALVKPGKRLSDVTVDSVLGKWKNKSFARGVDRDQIEKCEERLQIPLREFIEIAITSMQAISSELGL